MLPQARVRNLELGHGIADAVADGLAGALDVLTDGDRIRCNEVFDVGAADQALARFAELCASVQ